MSSIPELICGDLVAYDPSYPSVEIYFGIVTKITHYTEYPYQVFWIKIRKSISYSRNRLKLIK